MDKMKDPLNSVCFFVGGEEDADALVRGYYPPRFSENKQGDSLSLSEARSSYQAGKAMLREILETLLKKTQGFTVVQEQFHVDAYFRDSYYSYFSNQHFTISRFTHRLTFFEGNYSNNDLFTIEKAEKLASSFMGTCVICPTESRTLNRVLFNPKYLLQEDSCWLRTAEYKITVFGIRLTVNAFPFQMQDRETTRCAEVTLLNILDYYGHSYEHYRVYTPSEVIRAEQEFAPDRTLPSRGVNYFAMSKILSRFGFSPRLYSREAIIIERENMDKKKLAKWQEWELHHLLHYYVESGIPVAVNVADWGNRRGASHSLICIGLQEPDRKAVGRYVKILYNKRDPMLINAADYYKNYVVTDDNQLPYAVRGYRKLSQYDGMRMNYILVPLYKRMFLEASDAYDIVTHVLQDERLGLKSRVAEELLTEPVVIRLFLASSRTFKQFRVSHSQNQCMGYRRVYGTTPFPRFVWVAELYRKPAFEEPEGKAFGEIIIDATASTKTDIKSVIMLGYPDKVSIRGPNEEINVLNEFMEGFQIKPFPRFAGNLQNFA